MSRKTGKKANIHAIFKKGDMSLASNYRPISLTSVSCKIMEYIIFSHIMSHLEEFKTVSDIQHGFLKSHSCETQLLITLEDLARNLEHGKQSDIILLDFAKAFDTVPHQLLHDIEGVERRAARFVKNCYEREPGTLTNPLNDLNWHSLELRRKIARLTTMYKMVNNKIRVNIPEYIAHPTRVTRSYHSSKFKQQYL